MNRPLTQLALTFAAWLGCLSCAATISFSTAATAVEPPDFARRIQPLFNKYCNGCHNDDDREGGLSLASHAAMLKGGEHGGVVTPGNSEQSRLWRVVAGRAEPRMPPADHAAPSAAETALLAAWIAAGAKGPTGQVPDPADFATPQIKLRVPARRSIHAVAVSPSGDLLAIARHGVVELRRTADDQPVAELSGHRGSVNAVAFSHDGQWLFAAAGEPNLFGEARVWNVAERRLAKTLRGHRDSLLSVRPSPDGKLLATAGYDQKIKLWDWADGRELRTLEGHNGPVFEVAFRPDGQVLASASGDRTVKLWDVARGTRLDTLKEPLQELYCLAFAPDGRRLAAAGVDNRIRVWEISAAALEGENRLRQSQFAHEAPLLRIAFSADGRTLVSKAEDRLVKVWDAARLDARATLAPQSDWPVALALHPREPRAYVGLIDGTLTRLDYPAAVVTPAGTSGGSPAGAGSSPGPSPPRPLMETPALIDYGPQPALDQLTKTPEAEPNDRPANATPLAVPGIATGRITRAAVAIGASGGSRPAAAAQATAPPAAAASATAAVAVAVSAAAVPAGAGLVDEDLYRFTAKAGEQWVLEIDAARSGSPLDSKIQVLDVAGRPVPRLLLRAERDSEIEFRSMDSSQRGVRLKNYDEMLLNEYVYLNGEVIKHFQQRRGPDADSQFYPEAGGRFAFFDTTSRTHALGQPAYVVVPYPLGSKLPNNGLPVFTVNFENDDESQRKLGKDSRLTFTAPADGEYLVRVADVRGFGGDDYKYSLVVRRPQPAFAVTLGGMNPTVAAGSGKSFSVKAERIDNFMDPIQVDLTGLPPGYHASTPLIIQAGLLEARGVVYSDADAPPLGDAGFAGVKATAMAALFGKSITREAGTLGTLKAGPAPKVRVYLEPLVSVPPGPDGQPAVTIVPGQRAQVKLRIDRGGFTDRVSFEIENLPHGVIVDDIGLNGVLLPEGQTERVLFLSCEPWVPAAERRFHAVGKVEGDQASRPLWLRVAAP